MTHDTRLDVLARGWRGRLFAALVALIAGLPGLVALPALDRDEARFAQSTAQMLETGDFIGVRYQDQARPREPLALHWLQAAVVKSVSSAEARRIWAYRIPSLLGAVLAAAACAWGASAFFGPGAGAIAGAILGGCLILSTEAGIAKTDALFCGAVTLALAALAHIYVDSGSPFARMARRQTRLVFWLALALSVLDKGWRGPIMLLLTGLALWAWDRRAPWARRLGWGWGLIIFAGLAGPWLAAVTVRTDGLAWSGGPPVDLAGVGPGGQAPPALHLLMSPWLLFPFAALLPSALIEAWKARGEPGVRFALCWLIPNWVMLEIAPVRLIHDALPLYGALAWLAALAARRAVGSVAQWIGAVLSLLVSGAIAAGAVLLANRFGQGSANAAAGLVCVLAVGAGLAGALALSARFRLPALTGAAALGLAAHGAFAAVLLPRLKPLWISRGVVAVLDRSALNPQKGLIPGPVTIIGYAEPSLVFALGTETELGEADDAAEAISNNRPAVVEQSADAAFHQALSTSGLKADLMGTVTGLDYVDRRAKVLNIYRADPARAPSSVTSASEEKP